MIQSEKGQRYPDRGGCGGTDLEDHNANDTNAKGHF
jgi:hypothetical protein